MARKRVLVICTGNAARSQLAEALINHYLGESWQAFSAGTRPAGYVQPLALAALQELGIDTGSLASKSVDQFIGQRFDLVITVCDSAARECPFWPGQDRLLHSALPDPSDAVGDEPTRLAAFRATCDQIRSQIFPLLENLA